MEYKFKSSSSGKEFTAVLNLAERQITVNGFNFDLKRNGQKGRCLYAKTQKDTQGFLASVGINDPKTNNVEITLSDSDYNYFVDFYRQANEAIEMQRQQQIEAAPKIWAVEFDGVNLDGDYCPTRVNVRQYAVLNEGEVAVINRAFSKDSIAPEEARQMLEAQGLIIDWSNGYGRFECPEGAAREIIQKADAVATARREEKERAEAEEKRQVEAAFAEAKKTGNPVLISSSIGDSQDYDPGIESTTCNVYRYAMPDGTVKIEIQHYY